MHFATAGIDAPLWLPPLAGFVLAYFCSMVGISGAFLLLPFQMSVLGYVSPSVSATNLVFNLVAIPGGVWRYAKEGRLDWPLARLIALGTLPGLLAGWWLRLHWLVDPKTFKLFVGLVLGGLAIRLWRSRTIVSTRPTTTKPESFPARGVLLLSLVIGMIGGAYGIGGGALMSPVLVALFGLSLHAIAGATLFGTFLTSLLGVAAYQFLPAPAGLPTQPDWALGLMFGFGGLAGMYLGARTQKHVPLRLLETGLALLLAGLAVTYVTQFFR
ncbi:sulfite exporter TauE/SafE family protein [Sulfuricystis multivorans]|uniref:sulfite exporter TauE/SafE family protein n=1 Tax=Sulfuricystis multivorans TaxID=2211108 RepID=UPI000F837FFA|nr:sulfite exporter TauE/SafE family protein [Sulfuricystis multivorans]